MTPIVGATYRDERDAFDCYGVMVLTHYDEATTKARFAYAYLRDGRAAIQFVTMAWRIAEHMGLRLWRLPDGSPA